MQRFFRGLAGFILLGSCAFAQSTTSLNGTITDASGAVVPGVAIEIKNKQTDAARSTVSDHQGRYTFAQVAPGDYTLEAKAAGFKSEVISTLTLQVNSPATVNLTLQVGAVTEAVAVSAEAVTVNTTDASLGNAITEKPIVELPFEARNPVGLLSLQPGVAPPLQPSSTGIPDYRGGAVNGG